MLKKITLSLSCLLACGIFTGAAAQEKYMVDKIVAVVGNSAILYSEVEAGGKNILEERRKQGYTSDRDPMNEALEGQLHQKLLYNQALVDSVHISKEGISASVGSRIDQMVLEAGSISALEAREGMPIFDIRRNLQQSMEEAQYAQMMQMEVVSKVTITPGEVDRFFAAMDKTTLPIVPEQYVYAQITCYPESTQEAKQRVRERLLEMRERIMNGTRFDMLARMYSDDSGTARNGGEMDFMPLDGFVKPFGDALGKLQPGQISEIVETEFGFHIIQLVEKKNNLYKCRHILLRPSFTPEELAAGSTKLDSLAVEIRKGMLTFEEAALKYSDDKYSKQNGGLVTNHELLELYGANDTSYSSTRFFREELYGDYNIIRNMSKGDISNAFLTEDMRGNQMNKIIKLVDVIPAHPANMNDDYKMIEDYALQTKQMEEFEKWVNKKIEGMYIKIEPEFRTGEFLNENWIK